MTNLTLDFNLILNSIFTKLLYYCRFRSNYFAHGQGFEIKYETGNCVGDGFTLITSEISEGYNIGVISNQFSTFTIHNETHE